jgi:hypothetical protein
MGVVGLALAATALVSMPLRLHIALWRNERYAFTTATWLAPIVWLIAIGLSMKLLSA